MLSLIVVVPISVHIVVCEFSRRSPHNMYKSENRHIFGHRQKIDKLGCFAQVLLDMGLLRLFVHLKVCCVYFG